MKESLLRAARVWRDMQMDPNMLSGITVGEFDYLATGAFELIGAQENLRTSVPLLLWLKLTRALKPETPDFPAMTEAVEELLRLRAVRAALDELVEQL